MNSLCEKGNYNTIKYDKISNIKDILKQLNSYTQNEDLDTFLNEYKDSLCALALNFEKINKSKHGFDAQNRNEHYLEIKQASSSCKTLQCTFNDTTLEKAEMFKKEQVSLALAVSNYISDISFIIYGKNKEIGEYLEKRILKQFEKNIRRTQSISINNLLFKYNFRIKPVSMNRNEIIEFLNNYSKSYTYEFLSKIID